MRQVTLKRDTNETKIEMRLLLDGSGESRVDTGSGFLDHMLELFCRHGRFNLALSCKGDTNVDFHHTAEDVAIVLGRAFSQALGDRAGITRYGSFMLPMDEALVLCAIDICGRATCCCELSLPTEKIGCFDCELIDEFFTAFARELGAAIHLKRINGTNSHHIAEAAFKGFGRVLADAVRIDERLDGEVLSTKGTII